MFLTLNSSVAGPESLTQRQTRPPPHLMGQYCPFHLSTITNVRAPKSPVIDFQGFHCQNTVFRSYIQHLSHMSSPSYLTRFTRSPFVLLLPWLTLRGSWKFLLDMGGGSSDPLIVFTACLCFFNPMPHMSFTDFVVFPPGHGRSVTDFWGWDAHEARLRCPGDVSGDIGGCSARRALKPNFY